MNTLTFFGIFDDMATVHAVTNQSQNSQRVPRGSTANRPELGSNLFDRGGIETARAELLDENCQAVYNDHRSVGGQGRESVSAKGWLVTVAPSSRRPVILSSPCALTQPDRGSTASKWQMKYGKCDEIRQVNLPGDELPRTGQG
jgi:hypothetical protein